MWDGVSCVDRVRHGAVTGIGGDRRMQAAWRVPFPCGRRGRPLRRRLQFTREAGTWMLRGRRAGNTYRRRRHGWRHGLRLGLHCAAAVRIMAIFRASGHGLCALAVVRAPSCRTSRTAVRRRPNPGPYPLAVILITRAAGAGRPSRSRRIAFVDGRQAQNSYELARNGSARRPAPARRRSLEHGRRKRSPRPAGAAARLAECEILFNDPSRQALDPAAQEKAEGEYQIDRQRINDDLQRAIEAIRRGPG